LLDTNVIISSVLSSKGNPAEIMKSVRDDVTSVYYSAEILGEYKRVLSYERLNIAPETQKEIIDAMEEYGILINPVISDIPLPDESDRVFYDTAKEVDAILITGNMKHYQRKIHNDPRRIFTGKRAGNLRTRI